MTTETESIFIDTNVLVYTSVPTSPWHQPAVAWLERLESEGVEIWISGQVIRELLVNLSREEIRGDRSTSETIQQVDHFVERFRIAGDGVEVRQTLFKLVAEHGVQGKQVHDANIAATCITHGIRRLLTNNVRDFKRFASQLTIVPLQP